MSRARIDVTATEPMRIAAVLGGKRVLGKDVRSLADLERVVAEGLPKSALSHLARHLAGGTSGRMLIVHDVVPAATFKRRRDRLTREESERTERLARVTALAEDVLGDADEAVAFLREPHALLERRRPLDVALGEVGARRVEEILVAVRHGLPV